MTLDVLAVNTGQPQVLPTARGRTFFSAIAKSPALEPVTVGTLGIQGDAQANRRYHGGPHKALCAYIAAHFPRWESAFGLTLAPGAFGENLTLGGATTEADLCLGDTFRYGTLQLQISQPRQPCVNLVRRWGARALPAALVEHRACGFYFRVLSEGTLPPGAALTLEERPFPQASVAWAITALYAPELPEDAARLLDVTTLAPESRRLLARRLRSRSKSA